MQHFLLFAFVLTIIAYFSLFWASSNNDNATPVTQDTRSNDEPIVQQQQSQEVDAPKSTDTVAYQYPILGLTSLPN